jgi:hypothetical protein
MYYRDYCQPHCQDFSRSRGSDGYIKINNHIKWANAQDGILPLSGAFVVTIFQAIFHEYCQNYRLLEARNLLFLLDVSFSKLH